MRRIIFAKEKKDIYLIRKNLTEYFQEKKLKANTKIINREIKNIPSVKKYEKKDKTRITFKNRNLSENIKISDKIFSKKSESLKSNSKSLNINSEDFLPINKKISIKKSLRELVDFSKIKIYQPSKYLIKI